MIVTTDLLSLPGAELVKKEGVLGVYIPIEPGINLVSFKGEAKALLEMTYSPNKNKKKKYAHRGSLVTPVKFRDKALAPGAHVPRHRFFSWVWTNDSKVVGQADFYDIINEESQD